MGQIVPSGMGSSHIPARLSGVIPGSTGAPEPVAAADPKHFLLPSALRATVRHQPQLPNKMLTHGCTKHLPFEEIRVQKEVGWKGNQRITALLTSLGEQPGIDHTSLSQKAPKFASKAVTRPR